MVGAHLGGGHRQRATSAHRSARLWGWWWAARWCRWPRWCLRGWNGGSHARVSALARTSVLVMVGAVVFSVCGGCARAACCHGERSGVAHHGGMLETTGRRRPPSWWLLWWVGAQRLAALAVSAGGRHLVRRCGAGGPRALAGRLTARVAWPPVAGVLAVAAVVGPASARVRRGAPVRSHTPVAFAPLHCSAQRRPGPGRAAATGAHRAPRSHRRPTRAPPCSHQVPTGAHTTCPPGRYRPGAAGADHPGGGVCRAGVGGTAPGPAPAGGWWRPGRAVVRSGGVRLVGPGRSPAPPAPGARWAAGASCSRPRPAGCGGSRPPPLPRPTPAHPGPAQLGRGRHHP